MVDRGEWCMAHDRKVSEQVGKGRTRCGRAGQKLLNALPGKLSGGSVVMN